MTAPATPIPAGWVQRPDGSIVPASTITANPSTGYLQVAPQPSAPTSAPAAPAAGINPTRLLDSVLSALKVGPAHGFSELAAAVSAVFPAGAWVATGKVQAAVTAAWLGLVALVAAGRKLQGVRSIAAAESVVTQMIAAGKAEAADLSALQTTAPAAIAAHLGSIERGIHDRLGQGEDWVVGEIKTAVADLKADVGKVADHLPQIQASRAAQARKAAPPA